MRRRALSMLAVVAAGACSTAVDEQALARLQPGRTTVDQAIEALGKPKRDETLADGSRMLTYVGSATSTRTANFVPGAVYAWGGWDVTSNDAGLMFDKDGRLRFWAWSSNQRPSIKVVGKDTVPGAVADLDVRSESPLPEGGKGAMPSPDYSAN